MCGGLEERRELRGMGIEDAEVDVARLFVCQPRWDPLLILQA